MKKIEMIEFHNRETENDDPISDQFHEWLYVEGNDFSEFKPLQMTSHATNDENQGRVETLFIVYEYEVTVKIK